MKKYDDADDADSGDDLDSSDSDDSGDDEEALEKELEKIRKEREEARKKKVRDEPYATITPSVQYIAAGARKDLRMPRAFVSVYGCRRDSGQCTSALQYHYWVPGIVIFYIQRTHIQRLMLSVGEYDTPQLLACVTWRLYLYVV